MSKSDERRRAELAEAKTENHKPSVAGEGPKTTGLDRAKYRYFDDACANTAFFVSELPEVADKNGKIYIKPETVILNDGSQPKGGDQIVCGSCRAVITVKPENFIKI